MEYKALAQEVAQIAREAGAAIMAIYGRKDFNVELKADESPLTVADKTANELICAKLEKLSVQYPIISEENKTVPFEVRRHYEYHWLVDPLDGTKEFIKRNGEFTVNIALIHKGDPVMGVVHVPCFNQTFWGARGEGAYLEEAGMSTRLDAAAFQMTDQGLGVVCSRSHLNDDTQAFVDQLDEPELVPKGSSLKFLILAKGEAHLYPRLGPTMEWDTAAAQAVLEQAGGKVIDNETHAPLKYNKENLLNPHFVAYGRVG